MGNPLKPKLLSIGPTGVGHSMTVVEMPQQDAGVFAKHTDTILVWDSAVIAYLLSDVAETFLITNHLGLDSESERLRSHLGNRTTLVELGPERAVCPTDVIIVEEGTSTRRWISSQYCPDPIQATSEAINHLSTIDPTVEGYIYLEAAAPPLGRPHVIHSIAQATPENVRTLINFGDTSDWRKVEAEQPWRLAAQHSILQWSLNSPPSLTQLKALDHSRTRAELRSNDCSLIITLGKMGAILVTLNGIVQLPVEPITEASTVGAGAMVSTDLLRSMIKGPHDDLTALARSALARATDYVRQRSFGLSKKNPTEVW